MAWAPREPYFKYTCNACGWNITIVHRSDVWIGDPRECEKCGSKLIALTTSKYPGIGSILKTIFKHKG